MRGKADPSPPFASTSRPLTAGQRDRVRSRKGTRDARSADDTAPAGFLVALLFVIERFAVGAYLDFRLLPVCIDLGLVGYQFVFLG